MLDAAQQIIDPDKFALAGGRRGPLTQLSGDAVHAL
jgi:hypothetical protein